MNPQVNTYKIAKNLKLIASCLIEDCDEFDFSANSMHDEKTTSECCSKVTKDIRAITSYISMILDEMSPVVNEE